MRVCGLKHSLAAAVSAVAVTPYAGVWIETDSTGRSDLGRYESHPMRVCGLKQYLNYKER